MAYCKHCRAKILKNQKYLCKGLRASGVKTPITPAQAEANGSSFVTSSLVAYVTDSAILGAVVGGSMLGGIVGDIANDGKLNENTDSSNDSSSSSDSSSYDSGGDSGGGGGGGD